MTVHLLWWLSHLKLVRCRCKTLWRGTLLKIVITIGRHSVAPTCVTQNLTAGKTIILNLIKRKGHWRFHMSLYALSTVCNYSYHIIIARRPNISDGVSNSTVVHTCHVCQTTLFLRARLQRGFRPILTLIWRSQLSLIVLTLPLDVTMFGDKLDVLKGEDCYSQTLQARG